jgi:hypothetical protein
MSPLNVAICTTISYTLRVEWYYIKNNYLTLRLKVKVPQRSLQYTTHRLMVMHPHTEYHWPISKDKNVMAWTRKYYLKNNYLTLRSKSHEGHYGMRHTALCSCTHIPNIIDLSGKTKKVMVWTSFAEKKRKKKIKTKTICFPRGDIIKCLSINTCIPHPLLGCNNQHGFLDLRRETTCRSQHH